MPAKLSNPKIPQQPRGIPWSDDMYLTSTSEIDGRRRWQEIVLLLASKLHNTEKEDLPTQFDTLLSDSLKSEEK